MKQGDKVRVKASGSTGVIAYVRMAAPDYTKVEAASVVLDHRLDDPAYTGTMFSADAIEPNE